MITRVFTIFFSLFVMLQSGFCVEQTQHITKIPEDYKINFLLPINWASDTRYNLKVAIPEGLRSLQEELTWSENSTSIIEFIPKNETDDNWSEIITINKHIGKNISATNMIDTLKTSILAQTNNGKVWKENLYKKESYMSGSLGLSYDSNGKHEIFGCRYYSGPYDCVGIQYTIRPKKDVSDEEAQNKIENFFNSNTQVITTQANEEASSVANSR